MLGIVLIGLLTSTVSATSPSGDVRITTPFPRVQVDKGHNIQSQVTIYNDADEGKSFDLSITSPNGWYASLNYKDYVIKSIFIDSKKSSDLDFNAYPFPNTKSGNYTFLVDVLSRDKISETSLTIEVDVANNTAIPSGIALSSPNPSMEAATGNEYEFSVTVTNLSNEGKLIDLTSTSPANWKVTFMPAYENNQILSMALDPNISGVLRVTVIPPQNVVPGSYDIIVMAKTGTIIKDLHLKVSVTGTFNIALSPQNNLLSLDAEAGKEAYLTLTTKNSGTGTLSNLLFSSGKPTGWDVQFAPDSVSSLSAGYSVDTRVIIKPPSDSIPGDYSVTLSATADPLQTHDEIELRVTVYGSQTWGYTGIGIIVSLVALLLVVFWRFGRR